MVAKNYGYTQKGKRMRSCTCQPPEPQYARALVLGDAHMVPPSLMAAILKNGYQLLYFAKDMSRGRVRVAKERSVHTIKLL